MKEVQSLSLNNKSKNKNSGDTYIKQAIFAGVLTLIFYLISILLSSKYPLGKYTFIIGDLEAQYAPFLFLYKHHLQSLNWSEFFSSFTYSFNLGAGKNIMGTLGYYLSSPLNLFVFLFDETQVNEFIMFLVAIKLALSASFMSLFIHERGEDKKSNWPVLFGIMYAFSSYTMAFMFQIMWLDGYALLPLLLYCIEKFLKDKRVTRIIPVLLLLFLSNYYIAYMVGIFSFFYLIARMLVEKKFVDVKEAKTIISKFVVSAIASGLTLCIILIPVGLDTLKNGDPISHVQTGENLVHYSVVDLLDQLFLGYPGEYGDVMPTNMPLIFVSLMVTLLCVIYFISDEFKGFERKVHAVCMVLVYLSLSIVFVDKAWQVFDDPNWFQHREAFVFMPLFMVVAYKVFEKIKKIDNRVIGKGLLITLGILFVAQSFGEMKTRDSVFLFNLFFLVALALIFMGMKRTKWPSQLANMNKILNIILAIMIVFEVVAMSPVLSAGVSTMSVYYGEAQEYVDQIQIYKDFTNSKHAQSDSFRLLNITNGPGLEKSYINGNFYTGANGMTLFNSNSNKTLHRFLKQFGYSTNYNYFVSDYSFEAPDTDAFFSIGRVISPNKYSYGTPLAKDDWGFNLVMYGNENVLPLAFAVDKNAFEFDFYSLEKATSEKNYFVFRNNWYKSLFPSSFSEDFYIMQQEDIELEVINANAINLEDYIKEINSSESASASVNSSTTSSSVFDPDKIGAETANENKNTTTYYRVNEKLPIILNYTLTCESEGELYLNLSFARLLDECTIYVNGEYLNYWSGYSFYSQVARIGSFNVGEKVQVTIVADTNKFGILDVNFAYFDYDVFAKSFDTVDTSEVEVISAENGVVQLTSNLKDDKLILTTIPYEDGWTLYVDGQKQEITVYEEALIGINAGPGTHEITLKFVAPGTKLGAVCTVIGIAGLALIIFTDKKKTDSHKITTSCGIVLGN